MGKNKGYRKILKKNERIRLFDCGRFAKIYLG